MHRERQIRPPSILLNIPELDSCRTSYQIPGWNINCKVFAWSTVLSSRAWYRSICCRLNLFLKPHSSVKTYPYTENYDQGSIWKSPYRKKVREREICKKKKQKTFTRIKNQKTILYRERKLSRGGGLFDSSNFSTILLEPLTLVK